MNSKISSEKISINWYFDFYLFFTLKIGSITHDPDLRESTPYDCFLPCFPWSFRWSWSVYWYILEWQSLKPFFTSILLINRGSVLDWLLVPRASNSSFVEGFNTDLEQGFDFPMKRSISVHFWAFFFLLSFEFQVWVRSFPSETGDGDSNSNSWLFFWRSRTYWAA